MCYYLETDTKIKWDAELTPMQLGLLVLPRQNVELGLCLLLQSTSSVLITKTPNRSAVLFLSSLLLASRLVEIDSDSVRSEMRDEVQMSCFTHAISSKPGNKLDDAQPHLQLSDLESQSKVRSKVIIKRGLEKAILAQTEEQCFQP